MVRVLAAASAALLALGLCPAAPPAGAAEGDQTVRVQNGQIRCLLSTDYQMRGRPAAVCGRTDGQPFQVSPVSPPALNLVVVLGSGEMYYIQGTIPIPESADTVLGVGQTYQVNGWRISTEELRTLVTYDDGGHGIRLNPVEVMAVWI